MKNIYQCEMCGKIFVDYDECRAHEESHWQVASDWYRKYEKATAEFTKYCEKYEAPSVVAVELKRWDSEAGEYANAVAVYKFQELITADSLVSDEERIKREEEAKNEEA